MVLFRTWHYRVHSAETPGAARHGVGLKLTPSVSEAQHAEQHAELPSSQSGSLDSAADATRSSSWEEVTRVRESTSYLDFMLISSGPLDFLLTIQVGLSRQPAWAVEKQKENKTKFLYLADFPKIETMCNYNFDV